MGKKRVRCLFYEALGSYSNLINKITHLFPTRINVKRTFAYAVGRVSCIATAKSLSYQGQIKIKFETVFTLHCVNFQVHDPCKFSF